MNIALNDGNGDGYGVFANVKDAVDEATRLGILETSYITTTDAPVNNGNG